MMQWFGRSWGAPVCSSTEQVPVPVGDTCAHCGEPIAADDSGIVTPFVGAEQVNVVPYHVECWMRILFGSTGHQLRLCPCFGGTYEGEPPEMSRRDAARAAWALAREREAQRRHE